MQCPYCKNIIPDGSVKCEKCGAYINYQNNNLYFTDNLKGDFSSQQTQNQSYNYGTGTLHGQQSNYGSGTLPNQQPYLGPTTNQTPDSRPIPQQPKKESKLGIWALILTGIICTFPVGAILGIIDVLTKDGKKKTCSIIALSLCAVFTVVGLIGYLSDDDSKNKKTNATTQATTETQVEDDENGDDSEELLESDDETGEKDEISEDDYQAQCVNYEYEDVMRTPKDYEGKYARFEGTVVQVDESEAWFSDDVNVIYRVAEGGDYDKIWYVEYTRSDPDEARILENDYVTMFGICDGVTSYITVLGSTLTIPKLKAEYVYNGKVDSENGVITFDKDTIISNLDVTEYYQTNGGYYDYYIILGNTSEFDVDLNVSVKFYDEDGNLVGADDETEYAVGHGNSTIMEFDCDSDFSKAEYVIDVAPPDTYVCVDSDVEYEVLQSGDKLIVTVKNNSSKTITNVTAEAIFFSGGNVVGSTDTYFGDMDYELKSGGEETEELSCYEYFDDYKIFVHASTI